MRFKAGKSIQFFYFFTLLLVLGGMCSWFYYFFQNGALNSEVIWTLSESSQEVERLRTENQISKIDQWMLAGRVRDAIGAMSTVEKTSKIMDRNVKHFPKEYKAFLESSNNLKSILNNLLSLPDVLVVLNVLHKKFEHLQNSAKENKWPTLTRISSVMLIELDANNLKKIDFFNYSKMHRIDSNLGRSLKSMENITNGSTLSTFDKTTIMAKLQNFKVEQEMLGSYLPELKKYAEEYQKLNIAYNSWLKLIEPEIAIAKMSFQKNSQMMIVGFAGMLVFLLLAIVFGFWLYKKNVYVSIKKIETRILECVQEGIIAPDFRMNDHFSKDFYQEMQKYHSWVKSRMSFGNIFQEALPFPALLLDSNLNLVWANTLFYSEWNLNEYKNKRDALNWEFLQRFTNLGENDPILEALNNNLAGIYQIQVKQEQRDLAPYEMYISPVVIDDQKRIMVFFYPLMFLEETIKDQKKSLLGPVCRSLEALIRGDFDKEFRDKVRGDFNIAGIESVFGKFIKLAEFLTQQKNGLVGEIERLENELYDRHKLLCDVKTILLKQDAYVKSEVKDFQESKDLIIRLVELRRKTEQIYLTTINASKIMLKEQCNLYDQSTQLVNNHEENLKIYRNIGSSREAFKEALINIDNCKSNVTQTLEQTLIFTKSAKINPESFSGSLMKIKLELRALDKEIGQFVSNLKNFDVHLSKMQMMIADVKPPDLNEYRKKVDMTRNHIENDTFNMGVNAKEGQKIDEDIIARMKSFYENIKGNLDTLTKISQLTADLSQEPGSPAEDKPLSAEDDQIVYHNESSFET